MELNQLEERFLKSCREDRIDTVKDLISQIDSVNFEDDRGNYPLKEAVSDDNLELAKLLLDNYAIVNWIDKYNESILNSINSVEMLELLMSHGLDIHYQEEEEFSPLQCKIDNINLVMIQALMQHGVKYQHLDLSFLDLFHDENGFYAEPIKAIIERDRFDNEVLEPKESSKNSSTMKI